MSYSGGGAQATVGNPWTLFTPPAAYRIVSEAGSYAATWKGIGSPQVSTVILALKTSGSN